MKSPVGGQRDACSPPDDCLIAIEHPHRYVPTLARGELEGRKCLAVAGGWRQSMVIDSEGGVFTWGWGSYGQLGLGGKTCALQTPAGQPCSTKAAGRDPMCKQSSEQICDGGGRDLNIQDRYSVACLLL